MDTGASSHMTSTGGNLNPYFNTSTIPSIFVGNGHTIPVIGSRSSTVPMPPNQFKLKNVLHTPNMTKNLISVKRFTIDNNVYVEFDPFGLM